MPEMPFYTCHKRVQALEIIAVGGFMTNLDTGAVTRPLQFSDGSERKLPLQMFARYVPQMGDFLVRYEDGYESFSPRKAFLDGYTREEAIEALPQRIDQALMVDHYPGSAALNELLRDCRAEIAYLRRLRNPALGPEGNVMMERLNDLAQQGDRSMPEPEWLTINNYAAEIARVAREAYVTINSLKHQVEQGRRQIERLQADVTVIRQMAGFKEVKSGEID